MDRLADILTKKFYDKDRLTYLSYETFRFGVQAALEMSAAILASIIIAVFLGELLETAIFLLTFGILRSYAGGIHLEKFSHCFVFSTAVMLAAILTVKYINPTIWTLHLLLVGGILAFYCTEPENDKNRDVDENENIYFKKKLWQSLAFIVGVYALCVYLGRLHYAFLLSLTVDVTYLLMILGKIKNGKI